MSGYIGNIPVPQATQTRDVFTATSGQTSFATSGYTPGFLDVWLNGVKLVNGTDFTATNGSDVVLASGAATSDIVEVLSYSTYEVNNQAFTGDFSVDGTTFKVDSTNNLVGVGNGSPISYYNGARNLVVGTTSGNNGITVVSGPTGVGRLYFADGTSGADLYRGYVEYSHNSNSLIFGTDGATRMVVDASGRITTDYQPMFSAFNLATGSQYPITYSTWATFDSNLTNFGSPRYAAETNIGSHFSLSNGRFTAPVTGRYLVSVNVGMWVGNTSYITFFKNGAYNSPYQLVYNADLGGYQNMTLVRVMTLAAGDYVEPGFYASSGTYATFIPGGGYIQFSGYLVG